MLPPRPPLISASMEAGIGVMGTKLGMMSYFDSSGAVIPVTVVGFREGNIVTQVKTEATDGYDAVQVGYRRVRDRKLTKPELGHLEKSGIIPLRHLQEFRLQSVEGFEPNQRLAVDERFKEGDLVDVSGTTIGKGFQGGIKRHNFKRGLMSHGSKSHRELGSIGAGTTPGRVYKGKKMPGRMGGTKTKIRKLKIVKIDNDLNVVMIKGAVPELILLWSALMGYNNFEVTMHRSYSLHRIADLFFSEILDVSKLPGTVLLTARKAILFAASNLSSNVAFSSNSACNIHQSLIVAFPRRVSAALLAIRGAENTED
ncbi:50S ribosomal protein L3, chloroplastic [Sesamum angolense]|uniref:Large ribosomal subunit protein uL3c n=1 Tax=Sesamum angolense TaxID=2727404 RepID=A0AAE2C6K4_9LAMI|nr:50S ribosomal protein L3, chloroplastic [Sesamum angolense]